jgi:hypothetical protein
VARKAVLLGLVVVLALGAFVVVGCGGSSSGASEATAKAAVVASLAKIDAAVADLTAKGTNGTLTVAGIKATRDSLKAEVQSVIDNAKNIKGADVSKIQTAWSDLDAAVTALPDTATLMDAAAVLLTKVAPLTSALAQVKALVSPSTSST